MFSPFTPRLFSPSNFSLHLQVNALSGGLLLVRTRSDRYSVLFATKSHLHKSDFVAFFIGLIAKTPTLWLPLSLSQAREIHG